MVEKAFVLQKKYDIVDEDDFFKILWENEYNVSDLWPDRKAPDTLVVMRQKPDPENKELIEEIELEEKYSSSKREKILNLTPEVLLELNKNGAVEPVEGTESFTKVFG